MYLKCVPVGFQINAIYVNLESNVETILGDPSIIDKLCLVTWPCGKCTNAPDHKQLTIKSSDLELLFLLRSAMHWKCGHHTLLASSSIVYQVPFLVARMLCLASTKLIFILQNCSLLLPTLLSNRNYSVYESHWNLWKAHTVSMKMTPWLCSTFCYTVFPPLFISVSYRYWGELYRILWGMRWDMTMIWKEVKTWLLRTTTQAMPCKKRRPLWSIIVDISGCKAEGLKERMEFHLRFRKKRLSATPKK